MKLAAKIALYLGLKK